MTDLATTDGFALRAPDALALDRPCVAETVDPDEDGPWGRRCVTHGQLWTSSIGCEVAQRRARAEIATAREERDHERRKKAEASRAGLLALVEVGVTLWSSTRKSANELAIGGVVVAIEDFADEETGERERRFHVLDPFARPVAVHVIAEWDVNRTEIQATPSSTMARLFRRVAWELWSAGKPRKDGTIGRTSIDSRDADRVRWLVVLAKQLLGGTI